MLCLADIQLDIFCLTILSDDHSRINLFTCTNKESTTFLGTVKSVSYRLTGLECDQRSLLTVLDISFIWSISLKTCIDDTISLCISHELTTVSDQTTCRNQELKTGITSVGRCHVAKFPFPLTKFFNDNSGKFIRDINIGKLHRFCLLPVFICMVENFCFTYCELISFTTHILDQDRKVKLSTTGNFEAVGILSLFYTEADISIKLTEKTVTKMTGSYELSFLSGKWTVIYDELHGDRRL